MSQAFGIPAPCHPSHAPHQEPARYLVLIQAAGASVAKLFLASRQPVAEFDGASEEVGSMTGSLLPTPGADGPEWDAALAGHSAEERRQASVFTLAV